MMDGLRVLTELAHEQVDFLDTAQLKQSFAISDDLHNKESSTYPIPADDALTDSCWEACHLLVEVVAEILSRADKTTFIDQGSNFWTSYGCHELSSCWWRACELCFADIADTHPIVIGVKIWVSRLCHENSLLPHPEAFEMDILLTTKTAARRD
jgi:hypothetical protein